jgi:hypothetical protein
VPRQEELVAMLAVARLREAVQRCEVPVAAAVGDVLGGGERCAQRRELLVGERRQAFAELDVARLLPRGVRAVLDAGSVGRGSTLVRPLRDVN